MNLNLQTYNTFDFKVNVVYGVIVALIFDKPFAFALILGLFVAFWRDVSIRKDYCTLANYLGWYMYFFIIGCITGTSVEIALIGGIFGLGYGYLIRLLEKKLGNKMRK